MNILLSTFSRSLWGQFVSVSAFLVQPQAYQDFHRSELLSDSLSVEGFA